MGAVNWALDSNFHIQDINYCETQCFGGVSEGSLQYWYCVCTTFQTIRRLNEHKCKMQWLGRERRQGVVLRRRSEARRRRLPKTAIQAKKDAKASRVIGGVVGGLVGAFEGLPGRRWERDGAELADSWDLATRTSWRTARFQT